jgi:two-component system invasion response regulator UvrY
VTSKVELKVLLVEDSILTAERLSELIRSVDCPVTILRVETERDALARVREAAPDVVVLDLRLKEGSGLNVLRKIAPLQPKPFIVVMTNYAQASLRDYALETGADFFLDKGLELHSLPTILQSRVDRDVVN